MGVTSFLLLSCFGLAITAQAQDCSRPVGGPNMSLKDSDILLETFPDGTRVSFACDVGYVSAGGSSSITCTAGSWSHLTLKCERRNCGSAGELPNGHVDYSEGTQFGDKIVISCNPGYTLVGKSEIRCGVQGWEGRLPECEVVICEPPPAVVHGTFSPNDETYEYSTVVQYTCQKGYTLSGSQSLTCSDDGTFQPGPPTCIMVECADPDIQNAEWTGGSRPPYGYKATVTYQCRSGYTMTGARTLTCGIDNQWSPGLPTCKQMTTTTKAPTTTTTTTTTPPRSTKKPKTTPDPTDPPATPDPTDSSGNSGSNRPVVIGIVIVVILIVSGTIIVIYFIFKKRSREDHEQVATKEDVPLA